MSTIDKRKNKKGKTIYRLQVRLKGFPAFCGTYYTYKEAKEVGLRIEKKMLEERKEKKLKEFLNKI